MIKNRTAQLIFETVYCTLGIVGFIACLGVFDDVKNLHWDFYIHFTNISNFLCIGIMFAGLIQTARKKEDSYVSAVPVLKFIGIMAILMTFVVFNFMLAGAPDRDPQLNWRIGSLAYHVVLPVMYLLDWFLFYERKKVKWYYPIASLSFPLAYLAYIIIHAAIRGFDTSILIPGTQTPLIYPYFFVNFETQGILGVAKWMLLFFVVFMTVGYIFFGIDKLLGKKKDKAA